MQRLSKPQPSYVKRGGSTKNPLLMILKLPGKLVFFILFPEGCWEAASGSSRARFLITLPYSSIRDFFIVTGDKVLLRLLAERDFFDMTEILGPASSRSSSGRWSSLKCALSHDIRGLKETNL